MSSEKIAYIADYRIAEFSAIHWSHVLKSLLREEEEWYRREMRKGHPVHKAIAPFENYEMILLLRLTIDPKKGVLDAAKDTLKDLVEDQRVRNNLQKGFSLAIDELLNTHADGWDYPVEKLVTLGGVIGAVLEDSILEKILSMNDIPEAMHSFVSFVRSKEGEALYQ